MLNFKSFTYFYISLVFFLQLLYHGGLTDFTGVPAMFSFSLLYVFVLLFGCGRPAREGAGIGLPAAARAAALANLLVLGATVLLSQCVEISYIELSKYACGAMLALTLFAFVRSAADFREFASIFSIFSGVYFAVSMVYYFISKFVLGNYFSGICFTLVYPYYHATYALAMVPLAAFLYLTAATRRAAGGWLALTLMISFNVMLTSSRIAQVNLMLMVAAMCAAAFVFAPKRRAAVTLISCYLILAVFAAVFATDAFARIAGSFSANENYDIQSGDGRLQIYRGAWQLFLERPLTGTGLGLTSLFLPKYRVTTFSLVDCHNIFLQRLCEGGAIYLATSLISFFMVIAAALAGAFSFLRAALHEDAASKPATAKSAGNGVTTSVLNMKCEASGAEEPPETAQTKHGTGVQSPNSAKDANENEASREHHGCDKICHAEVDFMAWAAGCAAAASLFSLYFQGLSMPHNYLGALVYMEFIATGLCFSAAAFGAAKHDPPAPDFTFDKWPLRAVALFSLTVSMALSFIVLNDMIESMPQWYLNTAFIMIFWIMGVRFNPRLGEWVPKRQGLATRAALITVLILINLAFLWPVFVSGFACEEGISALAAGNAASAIERLEKCVLYYPNLAGLLHLSCAEYETKNYRRAATAAEYYNRRLPYELVGINNLAAANVSLGNGREAFEALSKLDAFTAERKGSAFLGAHQIASGDDPEKGAENFAAAALRHPGYASSIFTARLLYGGLAKHRAMARPRVTDMYLWDAFHLIETAIMAEVRKYAGENQSFQLIPASQCASTCRAFYCLGLFAPLAKTPELLSSAGAQRRYYLTLAESMLDYGAIIPAAPLRNAQAGFNAFAAAAELSFRLMSLTGTFIPGKSQRKDLTPHYAHKRWMYEGCMCDPYGITVQTIIPPAWMVTTVRTVTGDRETRRQLKYLYMSLLPLE